MICRVFLLLLLMFGAIAAPLHAMTCEEATEAANGIDPRIWEVREQILALDFDLLNSARPPQWQDLENIKKLADKAENLLLEINGSPEKSAAYNALLPSLRHLAGEDATYAALLKPKGFHSGAYGPTDYKLMREYQDHLKRLNAALGKGLKIQPKRLHPERVEPKMIADAEAEVARQSERLKQTLHTMGYKDMDEYRAAIKAMGPEAEALLKLLQDGEIDITIRRPLSGRWWIPRVGFHNQFVTGTSRGSLDYHWRHRAESGLMDIPLEKYEPQDHRTKPKYGSADAFEDKSKRHNTDANQYGPDRWVMKKNKVGKRLMWTPGDSLGYPTGQGRWDNQFIPWEFRELMVPFLLEGYHQGKFDSGRNIFPGIDHHAYSHSYLEIQILGPIDLTDVAEFHFKDGEVPTGEFLEALKAHDIKIFDYSSWPPQPWSPSE